MSRSIHTTVHHWADLRHWDFADEDVKSAQRARLLGQLVKKRRLTRRVIAERRTDAAGRVPSPVETIPAERVPSPVETIPIGVAHAGPLVHYPAGPDDVRGVMRRLPPGVLDGLGRVDLQLGSHEQSSHRQCTCELVADPFVGRLSRSVIPGVYTGHILGMYQPS